MVTLKRSEAGDIDLIKDCLRKCDVDEIWKSNRHSPEEALKEGLRAGMCFTAWDQVGPIAMFGVIRDKDNGGRGIIWMLGTDNIRRYPKEVLGKARKVIGALLAEFDVLYNFIDVNNETSIRFLSRLGARFDQPKKYGVEGDKFMYFEIRQGEKNV